MDSAIRNPHFMYGGSGRHKLLLLKLTYYFGLTINKMS